MKRTKSIFFAGVLALGLALGGMVAQAYSSDECEGKPWYVVCDGGRRACFATEAEAQAYLALQPPEDQCTIGFVD